MQTVAQYAASVVEKYQIEPDVGSPPHKAADAIIPMLKKWGGKELLGITLSGAYAKGHGGFALFGRRHPDFAPPATGNGSEGGLLEVV